MMTLLEMVGGLPDSDESTILPEAAVERLREFHERYRSRCPFRPGDLVRARPDAPMAMPGPALVLEVRECAGFHFSSGDSGSTSLGMRLDVRVAFVGRGDKVVMLWTQSVDLCPYDAE